MGQTDSKISRQARSIMSKKAITGALITRLAILFTASGPAGKFTEMNEETKKKLEEIGAKSEKSG